MQSPYTYSTMSCTGSQVSLVRIYYIEMNIFLEMIPFWVNEINGIELLALSDYALVRNKNQQHI